MPFWSISSSWSQLWGWRFHISSLQWSFRQTDCGRDLRTTSAMWPYLLQLWMVASGSINN